MEYTKEELNEFAQKLIDAKGVVDESLQKVLEKQFGTIKGYDLYKTVSDTKAFPSF